MLKESELKKSRKWKYKELKFDFEEYEQISMFEDKKFMECKQSKHK